MSLVLKILSYNDNTSAIASINLAESNYLIPGAFYNNAKKDAFVELTSIPIKKNSALICTTDTFTMKATFTEDVNGTEGTDNFYPIELTIHGKIPYFDDVLICNFSLIENVDESSDEDDINRKPKNLKRTLEECKCNEQSPKERSPMEQSPKEQSPNEVIEQTKEIDIKIHLNQKDEIKENGKENKHEDLTINVEIK